MTPPRSPAGHAGRILVRADETDVDILSQVIAEAFFDLPPSEWLAPDPAAVPHQHLASLAVRPGQQGQRTGTALLAARHTTLDTEGIPAFLQASGPDSRRFYLRHGSTDYGPRIELPGGPALYPMWRPPHDPHQGQDAGRQQ